MVTKILNDAKQAGGLIRNGGLVAFPTETVYGLGADATNPQAIDNIFRAKGRPNNNPLIVHLASIDAWHLAARELPSHAVRLLDVFAPGPITIVLPKLERICDAATGGLSTVGIRIPASTMAREVCRAAGCPVAAPSANRSGKPSCTTWQAVLEDLDGAIDAVLQGDTCELGIESTVVDCTGRNPTIST